MRAARIVIGICLWVALLAAGLWSVDRKVKDEGFSREEIQSDVTGLLTSDRQVLPVQSTQALRFVVGDPVFRSTQQGIVQVGEVSTVFEDDKSVRAGFSQNAEVVLYDGVNTDTIVLTHYTSPDSLAATVATMLPPEKRMQIATEIRNAAERHKDEIVAELKPLIEKSIRESVKVLEEELTLALRRHREDFSKLGARYQRDLVNKEVVPLVREELLPIVRTNAQPLAEDIGKVLWDKLSLWRFGWRYLYDKSPLPERDRVKNEWTRFMEKEIVPEFEKRSDDIVKVVQKIFSEAAKNKEVRAAVKRNLSSIIEDPEVHRIVWQILREVMVDSPRVREVLERTWKSPEAQKAFQLASARFEPTAVRIGEMLFGTPEGGITPEFAAVLRRQILNKDQRWLVIGNRNEAHPTPGNSDAVAVLAGGENSAYPGRIRGAE